MTTAGKTCTQDTTDITGSQNSNLHLYILLLDRDGAPYHISRTARLTLGRNATIAEIFSGRPPQARFVSCRQERLCCVPWLSSARNSGPEI
jgi:hypothetical protein